ncbi:hypothetical protein [Rhodoplanes serenus]|uniref:hypothetical protein n=1 Tax=Rhodoplanes serenus TaxID=200615 RepID=UPI0011B93E6D|nr:hypothetical protein [Rhodoplanes serenus]
MIANIRNLARAIVLPRYILTSARPATRPLSIARRLLSGGAGAELEEERIVRQRRIRRWPEKTRLVVVARTAIRTLILLVHFSRNIRSLFRFFSTLCHRSLQNRFDKTADILGVRLLYVTHPNVGESGPVQQHSQVPRDGGKPLSRRKARRHVSQWGAVQYRKNFGAIELKGLDPMCEGITDVPHDIELNTSLVGDDTKCKRKIYLCRKAVQRPSSSENRFVSVFAKLDEACRYQNLKGFV